MSTTPFREACTFCNNRQDKIEQLKAELAEARKKPTYILKVDDGASMLLCTAAAIWTCVLAILWSMTGWKIGIARGSSVALVLWLFTAAVVWANKERNN